MTEEKEIQKRAMLVRLSISGWSGTVFDREVTNEVAARAGASDDAGRYSKRLMPKGSLADVSRWASEARKAHYLLTLPWDDSGQRLLPIKLHDKYKTRLDRSVDGHIDAKNELLKNYQDAINESKTRLGSMFRPEDYPTAAELGDKISMRYAFLPVPDAKHFIADLGEEDAARIREDIEKQVTGRIHAATESLYRRLAEQVTALSERLGLDEDGKPLVFPGYSRQQPEGDSRTPPRPEPHGR